MHSKIPRKVTKSENLSWISETNTKKKLKKKKVIIIIKTITTIKQNPSPEPSLHGIDAMMEKDEGGINNQQSLWGSSNHRIHLFNIGTIKFFLENTNHISLRTVPR